MSLTTTRATYIMCRDCDGHGATTPDHPNDPYARRRECHCDAGETRGAAQEFDNGLAVFRAVYAAAPGDHDDKLDAAYGALHKADPGGDLFNALCDLADEILRETV